MTKKHLIITASAISTTFFILGILSYPTLNRAYLFTVDFFPSSDPVIYSSKPSEYESRTQALFSSPKFQESCKAGAKSQVALEIAREAKQKAVYYLDEFDRNSVISQEIMTASPIAFLGATVASSTKKDVQN